MEKKRQERGRRERKKLGAVRGGQIPPCWKDRINEIRLQSYILQDPRGIENKKATMSGKGGWKRTSRNEQCAHTETAKFLRNNQWHKATTIRDDGTKPGGMSEEAPTTKAAVATHSV